MNGKRARALRKKALTFWTTSTDDFKTRVSLRKVYQHFKKVYKNGDK